MHDDDGIDERSWHQFCTVEDGVRWFGHGTPCTHPEWHH